MTIIVKGSECVLCRSILRGDEDLVAFPPFISNRRDPLSQFNDAAVHRRCLDLDTRGPRLLALLDTIRGNSRPSRRVCEVCRQAIQDPDDYFATGLLDSTGTEPIAKFNFLHFHASHVPLWEHFDEFRSTMSELQKSDRWDGPMVRFDGKCRWELVRSKSPHRG